MVRFSRSALAAGASQSAGSRSQCRSERRCSGGRAAESGRGQVSLLREVSTAFRSACRWTTVSTAAQLARLYRLLRCADKVQCVYCCASLIQHKPRRAGGAQASSLGRPGRRAPSQGRGQPRPKQDAAKAGPSGHNLSHSDDHVSCMSQIIYFHETCGASFLCEQLYKK